MLQKTYYDAKQLVDPETGEIYEVGEGEKFTKEKKVEPSNDVPLGRRMFMKLFISAAERMGEILTSKEIVMVMRLAPYVSYTDCILRMNGRGEVMDVGDIAKALGMEKKNTYRIVSSLEKKGVMGHHVTGSILPEYKGKARKVYTVNPFIYCKGQYVNRAVYEYYRTSGWQNID